jgi:hypothetical protein
MKDLHYVLSSSWTYLSTQNWHCPQQLKSIFVSDNQSNGMRPHANPHVYERLIPLPLKWDLIILRRAARLTVLGCLTSWPILSLEKNALCYRKGKRYNLREKTSRQNEIVLNINVRAGPYRNSSRCQYPGSEVSSQHDAVYPTTSTCCWPAMLHPFSGRCIFR